MDIVCLLNSEIFQFPLTFDLFTQTAQLDAWIFLHLQTGCWLSYLSFRHMTQVQSIIPNIERHMATKI